MPVRKFRNPQDIEDSLWWSPDDPSLSVAIARVWDFADRISERHFPSGVHKPRSLEETQELRDRGEEANLQRYWASKKHAKKTVR